MNQLLAWLERYLLPATARIVENRYMLAIRNAFIGAALPMIITGSLFLILAMPPIPADVTTGWLGAVNSWLLHERPALMIPFQFTFGLIALWVCYGIASHLGKFYKLDPSRVGLTAMAALLVFCIPIGVEEGGRLIGLSDLSVQRVFDDLGASGLFVAMITGIAVAELCRFLHNYQLVIRMPASVPPNVARAFEQIVPLLVTVGGAFALEWWATVTFSPHPLTAANALTLPQIVIDKLGFLVQASDTLPSAVLQILLMMLLWSVGIHGMNVVSAVAYPLWQNNLQANIEGMDNGVAATHIVSEPFYHMYAHLGGSGATLPLVLMLLRSRSQHLKSVGKVALVPGLFNINEPVVFGVPIALNPVMTIPFFVAPTVIVTVNWLAMHTGLVPVPTVQLPLTMPVFLSGFLADGSWRGAALQAVDLLIATGVYYPFFKLWEQRMAHTEKMGNP